MQHTALSQDYLPPILWRQLMLKSRNTIFLTFQTFQTVPPYRRCMEYWLNVSVMTKVFSFIIVKFIIFYSQGVIECPALDLMSHQFGTRWMVGSVSNMNDDLFGWVFESLPWWSVRRSQLGVDLFSRLHIARLNPNLRWCKTGEEISLANIKLLLSDQISTSCPQWKQEIPYNCPRLKSARKWDQEWDLIRILTVGI